MKDKPKTRTRHFRLEWNCSPDELKEFFSLVRERSVRASYYRAQIGELYLSVTGAFNDSNLYGEMLSDHPTVEDLLHEWRHKIRLLKTLTGRPQPELRWRASWIDLHALPDSLTL